MLFNSTCLLSVILDKQNNMLTNLKSNAFKTINHVIKTIQKQHYPTEELESTLIPTKHQPTPKSYIPHEFFENGEYNYRSELLKYFNTPLEKLELDDQSKMGYTYKCLGSVLWVADLISRYEKLKPSAINQKLSFKKIISKIINEGGDTDTNAATSGALLGSYLGYDQLPVDWLNGLPHKDWLENKINKLFLKMGI